MTKGEKYLAMAEKGMQKRRDIAEMAKQRRLEKRGESVSNEEKKPKSAIRPPRNLNQDLDHMNSEPRPIRSALSTDQPAAKSPAKKKFN